MTTLQESQRPFHTERGWMCEVSISELVSYASAIKQRKDWEEVRAFALRFFGTRSSWAVIETESVYDDEGGFFNSIVQVHVFDHDGVLLPCDLTLPYFQQECDSPGAPMTLLQAFESMLREEYRLDPPKGEAWETGVQDLAKEHVQLCFSAFDLPTDTDNQPIFLDQPPSIALPHLYRVITPTDGGS